MAAAQAQHGVFELGELLEENGAEVKYCIHPVAGRMPGHMNVLLAEANVPYEMLVEPKDVNPAMETVDVAVVIGANDVVNPAAPPPMMIVSKILCSFSMFIERRSVNFKLSGLV